MILDNTIGYMISRVARKIHYAVDEVFKAYGITVEQWVALKTIAEYEPLCQKALAEKIVRDRTPTPADMRHRMRRPPERGRALVARLTELDEHKNFDFLGALSEAEQEDLRRMLRKIEARL